MLRFIFFSLPLFVLRIVLFPFRLIIKVFFYRDMSLWNLGGQSLTESDNNFLNWLNAEINTGATIINIPPEMLDELSKAGLIEAKRMCKLAGIVEVNL